MTRSSRLASRLVEARGFLRVGLISCLASSSGCGDSEHGGVDIAASRKIAAERGIGPGISDAPAPDLAPTKAGTPRPRPQSDLTVPGK